MIKLGRYAACYFFILAVIGCGRHNQLSMQSREKEAVKTVKKSTQTKVSSKLKQTPQTAGVSLRSFVTMLAFLSQVTPTYTGQNTSGEITFYPKHRLVQVEGNTTYFYTWAERTEHTERDEHRHPIKQGQVHYKSLQDVFKVISNYNDSLKRIKKLEELGTKMIHLTNLHEFYDDPIHRDAAMHLITAGLEALLVARYEEAKQGTKKFFVDSLPSYETRGRSTPHGHSFKRDTQHMENLERAKRHGSILESMHKQKEMVQKIHVQQKRPMNRTGRRYGNLRN